MRALRRWLAPLSLCLLLPAAPQGKPGRVHPLDPGLVERAREAIARSEYEARASALGLQAPNRANGLRTYFAPEGVSLHDRARADAPPLLDLTLVGVGRPRRLAKITPGEVTHSGARVEIRRPGLAEWYVNSPAGLEQGFTVEKRPEGDGALELELRFANAAATATGAAELLFQASSGRSLRLSALRASDALGHPLDARLELAGGDRIRITVADAGAAYPVDVDPLLSSTYDTSFASDEAGSEFGFSIAMGDLNGDGYADVVIGAPDYDTGLTQDGAVFVFDGGASGVANGSPASANVLLQGNQAGAQFGYAVATGDFNGDGYSDVAVSALRYVSAGTQGAVFVFPGGPFGLENGNPGTAATVIISTASQLIVNVTSAGDVNGDGYCDLMVTSGLDLNPARVSIFLGSPSGLPSGSLTSASTQLTGDNFSFGSLTAPAGDVNGDGFDDVIIYEQGWNSNGSADFIYLGGATGIASGTTSGAATVLQGTDPNANFGSPAASAGDVNGDGYSDIVVGQSGEYPYNGAAFVFQGGPSGIASGGPSSAATVITSDVTSAEFGSGLASGDVNGDGYSDLVIGAGGSSPSGGGGVYVFLGSASGVASSSTLSSAYSSIQSGQPGAQFGSPIATGDVNGDGYVDVLIGSPRYTGAFSNEGAAYLSLGGPGGLVNGGIALASSTVESNQAGARLGFSVVNAGDLNGDGFDDLAVGAPDYDLGQTGEGIVLVFDGSANGLANGLPGALNPTSANAVIHGNAAQLSLGSSIAAAGDVNGDGYGDLLLGAPNLRSGGSALLYLGGPSGLPALATPANATAVLTSDTTGSEFGQSVAGIGDVNGDGFADIAVGAPNFGSAADGAVFIFNGSLAGIGSGSNATASAKIVGGQAGSSFGWAVAGAGDLNGDGFSDLAVGAPFYTDAQTNEGVVLVYPGSQSGIASGSLATASTKIESNQMHALLGNSNGCIASAGDFNGDGYDDLLIGSSLYLGPSSNEGAVFLYRGGPSGIPTGFLANASATFQGAESDVGLGLTVAGVGDVNGDGFADVAFGAVGQPAGSPEGVAYVVLGSAVSNFVPSWTMLSGVTAGLQGLSTGPYFGYSLAGADVNGDGYSDLLVGAQTASDPENGEGAAYLFYGNKLDRGHAVRLRQRRADTASAQLAPLGRAVTLNGFSAELTASDPNGRGRVAATFQVCPKGTAFGGASCVSVTTPFALASASTPTALLATTFSGLAANTLYHWRARVLYADATGPIPPNPAHGPWHRPGARAALEDVRTGTDTDGDGVPDAADNCPLVANPGQEDTGGMGPGSPPDKIGDACQCGSVAGDGHVDTTDVAAYRAALANPTGAALSADAQTRCRVLGRTGGCDIRQVSAIRRAIAAPSLLPIQSGPAAQFCVAALGS